MVYINHSFLPSLFLTEVQNYACALSIPIRPTSTTMVSPGGLPGILHFFRQYPGTPGEADESASDRRDQRTFSVSSERHRDSHVWWTGEVPMSPSPTPRSK